MNLAISNIAWNPEENQLVYTLMQKYGFSGLEIAPKKIFPDFTKVSQTEMGIFIQELRQYEIRPIAMQSLLFGEEWLFLFQDEWRKSLFSYLSSLIEFWAPLGISSFIFWSPKNRIYEDMNYERACEIAIDFFRELGDVCGKHKVYVCIEPNPTIYWWNFLTNTWETLDFVKRVNHKNIKIHIDLGTIIYNNENIDIIASASGRFTHFHISEPWLEAIQQRDMHKKIIKYLQNFDWFISIEMKSTSIANIEQSMKYISSIFN